ncbi:hypothetical protein JCM31271_18980 [Halorubrum trueperi]
MLARHDRLLEVGIGDRPEVALALAERGRDVVALDVDDVDVRTRPGGSAGDSAGEQAGGSLRVVRGDVVTLAEAATDDAISDLLGADAGESVDAVYACNLPAELQRPTVPIAERLDAACLFTTLGFEEPVVPVRRQSLSGNTLYVARDPVDD